jgi:hypothetical protein
MYVSSQLGWMGYLSWSVPMMAYALVSGSTYAMVGAISSMDSAGKSAASTGGAAAATGNVNQGNVGMNNYNANKVNAAHQEVTGQMARQKYNQGGVTVNHGIKNETVSAPGMDSNTSYTGAYAKNAGGSTVTAAGSPMIDGSINKANVSTASDNYTQAKSNAQSDQQSLTAANQTMVGSYNGLSSADKTTVNKDWNLSNKKSVSNAADYAHLSKGQMTDSNGVSLAAYMVAQGGISALGDKADAGLKLNLEHKFGMSKEQANSFTSKYQADQTQSLNNSLAKSHSTSIGKDSGFKNSVNDSLTATNTYSAAESKVKSAQSALTAAKSTTSQMTAKALPGFLTKINKQRGLTGKAAALQDTHIENQMAIGNQKYLKPFNNYLKNKSGIMKMQTKIGKDSGGLITKNISSQAPKNSYNKKLPAAGGDYTPYKMISTPTAKQRNTAINKNIQNASLLKNKALNYGSLTHKLGIGNPPAVKSNLGKPPTTKSIGRTVVGGDISGNTGLVAKTSSGRIRGQVVTNKYGTPEFKYKTSNGQTRVATISGGKGPGNPETFIGKNGTVHTLKDEHFESGGG